jgi:uncharacterized protein (TIGR02145 family)
MKRLLFLLTIFCVLNLNAQNYLISFTGTGASTTINRIIVENLTTGVTIILNGDDVLQLVTTVGISDISTDGYSNIEIYPNPMTDRATLMVSPPVEGNAVISVYDVAGKQVFKADRYLENCNQEFTLSGFKHGTYIINVSGNNYHLSGKLVSAGTTDKMSIHDKESHKTSSFNKGFESEYKGTSGTVDLEYNPGDILKLTAEADDYATVTTLIPTEDKSLEFKFVSCTDGDGYNYPVVEIGDQTWMAKNLRTVSYRNSELIGTTDPAALDISSEDMPKYVWAYSGLESNVDIYGRLYTWYAVTDSRSVCPIGWHLPTDSEWTALTNYLGGATNAWIKLRESGDAHWMAGTTMNTATNETGFTALPAGDRDEKFGFRNMSLQEAWWSATEHGDTEAWYRLIDFITDYLVQDYMAHTKKDGLSVRCLKD